MNKKQIGTIFILIITIGLVAVIAYFSFLLSDKSSGSVTQIKKTKASAVTYHKLLALNETPVPGFSSSSSISFGGSSSSDQPGGGGSSSSFPLPTEPLLAYQTSSISSSSQQTSSAVSLSSQSSIEVAVLSPTTLPPTTAPTAAPTLLVYRTISVSPTLIPPRDTGTDLPEITSSSSSKPKKGAFSSVSSPSPSIANKQLPETGWVQLSTILFIVAVTTVFVSFLF